MNFSVNAFSHYVSGSGEQFGLSTTTATPVSPVYTINGEFVDQAQGFNGHNALDVSMSSSQVVCTPEPVGTRGVGFYEHNEPALHLPTATYAPVFGAGVQDVYVQEAYTPEFIGARGMEFSGNNAASNAPMPGANVNYYAPVPVPARASVTETETDLDSFYEFFVRPEAQNVESSGPSCSSVPVAQDQGSVEQTTQFHGRNEFAHQLLPTHSEQPLEQIALQNSGLWREFDEVINEMRVTTTGKPLFPPLKYDVFNLEPTIRYKVGVKMVLQSQEKLQFRNCQWEQKRGHAAEQEVEWESNELFSREKAGREAMESGFDLSEMKIFNERSEGKMGNVSARAHAVDVRKMMKVVQQHAYMPMATLYRTTGLGWEVVRTAMFPETEFIVGTEYKNPALKKMKIEKNKHVTNKRRQLHRQSVSPSTSSSESSTTSPQPFF